MEQLEVFVRHCFFSSISSHKRRFPNFCRERCHQNLLQTLTTGNLTFFLDTAKGKEHFLDAETKWPIVKITAGTEASSFLQLLDHVEKLNLDPNTILYFVEDDYIHRDGWVDALFEAMRLPNVDYATLYDHQDKYFFPMYKNLQSKIFITPSCHWRTVPSTTQTFATRLKTLLEDMPIHRKFSTGISISQDHKKFTTLTKRGRTLISPMPGYSTHAEPPFASPCIDWEQILSRSTNATS